MKSAAKSSPLRQIAQEMVGPPPRGDYPTKLDNIAAFLDALDEIDGTEGQTEMQEALRRWVREINQALDAAPAEEFEFGYRAAIEDVKNGVVTL